MHVLKHLAVIARNVRASRFAVHHHGNCLPLEYHPQTVLFVRLKRQQLVVAFPVSRVAVAIRGVSVHYQELASFRPEPHTRDATAVAAAVFAGRGEVHDVGPVVIDFVTGSDVQANLVVQRDIHAFQFGAFLNGSGATEHLGTLAYMFRVDLSKHLI